LFILSFQTITCSEYLLFRLSLDQTTSCSYSHFRLSLVHILVHSMSNSYSCSEYLLFILSFQTICWETLSLMYLKATTTQLALTGLLTRTPVVYTRLDLMERQRVQFYSCLLVTATCCQCHSIGLQVSFSHVVLFWFSRYGYRVSTNVQLSASEVPNRHLYGEFHATFHIIRKYNLSVVCKPRCCNIKQHIQSLWWLNW